MGNLNCINCVSQKSFNGEDSVEVKHERISKFRKQLCFRRRNRSCEEDEGSYFSTIKIFERQRSGSRKNKDFKEDREGSNSLCPACALRVTPTSEQNDGNRSVEMCCKIKSLLQPPFKPLSTPSEALLDTEIIIIKVHF